MAPGRRATEGAGSASEADLASVADLGTSSWRDKLAARLRSLPPAGGRRVALGQVVTSPEGDRSWTVVAGGGAPAEVREGLGGAEVCLVAGPEAAARLMAGTPAGELLAEGKLKVRGDANALVEGYETLAFLGAALRQETAEGEGA